MHDASMHIGQAEIPTGITVGQPLMIQSH